MLLLVFGVLAWLLILLLFITAVGLVIIFVLLIDTFLDCNADGNYVLDLGRL